MRSTTETSQMNEVMSCHVSGGGSINMLPECLIHRVPLKSFSCFIIQFETAENITSVKLFL